MSFRHLDQYAAVRSPVTALPPVARLLATGVVAVGTATLPLGAWLQIAMLALMVLAAAVLARVPIPRVIVRMGPPLLLVVMASLSLLLLVPGAAVWRLGPLEVTDSGLLRFWSVLGRSVVALGAAVLFVSTTTFPEVVEALRQLRVPRTITAALGLAYRLLYIVMDEAERLQRAAASRNVGGGRATRRRLLVGVVAAVLGRSFARAERTHRSMLARGFRGDMPALTPRPMTPRAAALVAALGLVVAAVSLSARVL